MSAKERRQLLRQIRQSSAEDKSSMVKAHIDRMPPPVVDQKLMKLLTIESIEYETGARALLRGSKLIIGDRTLSLTPAGELVEQEPQEYCQGERCCAPLREVDLHYGDVGLCICCTEKLWGPEEMDRRQREAHQIADELRRKGHGLLLNRLKKVIMKES
ncbi:hypothetical protein P5G64_01980 [Serratia nevei]|nr:hypothetical protein [Serratia nevei]MDF8326240.1 hypothetical protein [Serratia nevei]MDF8336305.1 hypothetical protein [Serratia nevei]